MKTDNSIIHVVRTKDGNQSRGPLTTGLIGYAAIIAVGAILAYVVNLKSERDLNAALGRYKQASQLEAEQAAKNMSYTLKQLYQGIRTISLLPSVKTIDQQGKNLDDNAHESIVQIYNNMVSNVAVSEIYIVPVEIEPEQIDPNTGSFGEPILMYDGKVDDPNAPKEEPEKFTTIPQAEKKEEVEIYEYRLLKEHMNYFKSHYPTKDKVDGLHLPFIAGHEVLTCDNDDYNKTKADADRVGAVFSVPFFGPDGVLKGAIAAIIRNNILKDMMPASNVALINDTYQYVVLAKEAAQGQKSNEWIKQGKADPSLLFSAVMPVETSDPRSKWALWVGYPDAKFLDSGDAKAVHNFKMAGYGFAALLAVLGSAVWAILQRSARAVKRKIEELERDVAAKAAENERFAIERETQKAETEKAKRAAMQEMADTFEFSVKGVVSQVASSALQMQSGAESVTHIAADTKQRSSVVANASGDAAHMSSQVAQSAEEMTAAIREISTQTQKSSQIAEEASLAVKSTRLTIESLAEKSTKVGEVIAVITGIAGQINLLALNATIESARAGEAGKGFAVVATEVKNLAAQVGKATEEIKAQIGEMQAATHSSVASVMQIVSVVGQVSESASAIAAAVEEQSAVMNEISRNVLRTSAGTREISENIVSVQEGADKTGVTAHQVLASARNLSSQSDTLKQKVDEFLSTIRQA